MLDGFRSRWMTPCSCAASSAPAICRAIRAPPGSVDRRASQRACRRACAPSTSSMRQRLRARGRPRCRRAWRCSDDSARPRSALRARSAPAPLAIELRKSLRQHLECDVAAEPRVACPIHLAPYRRPRAARAPRRIRVWMPGLSIDSRSRTRRLRSGSLCSRWTANGFRRAIQRSGTSPNRDRSPSRSVDRPLRAGVLPDARAVLAAEILEQRTGVAHDDARVMPRNACPSSNQTPGVRIAADHVVAT